MGKVGRKQMEKGRLERAKSNWIIETAALLSQPGCPASMGEQSVCRWLKVIHCVDLSLYSNIVFSMLEIVIPRFGDCF